MEVQPVETGSGKIDPTSLEREAEYETRVFCLFYNNKTGNYRVTAADAVLVDTLINRVPFHDAINAMIGYAKGCGVKVLKKDIKT